MMKRLRRRLLKWLLSFEWNGGVGLAVLEDSWFGSEAGKLKVFLDEAMGKVEGPGGLFKLVYGKRVEFRLVDGGIGYYNDENPLLARIRKGDFAGNRVDRAV